jgi:hypothetical protein
MAKLKTKKQAVKSTSRDVPLYTLEVFIIGGPMTDRFIRKNRVISRTIQIRGDQTLEDLHYAIFAAFNREDEHMYEFQIGGKRPMDPKARRYTLVMGPDDLAGDDAPTGDVRYTSVGSLGLRAGRRFGYWFDFGDDWWHQINVVTVEAGAGRGKFPKVVRRVGKSPPQYPDWDAEEERAASRERDND